MAYASSSPTDVILTLSMHHSHEPDFQELGAREQALLGLLDMLAPQDRALLELRVIDGFTMREIASRLS